LKKADPPIPDPPRSTVPPHSKRTIGLACCQRQKTEVEKFDRKRFNSIFLHHMSQSFLTILTNADRSRWTPEAILNVLLPICGAHLQEFFCFNRSVSDLTPFPVFADRHSVMVPSCSVCHFVVAESFERFLFVVDDSPVDVFLGATVFIFFLCVVFLSFHS
jgi:hypothetical protein